MSSDPPGTATDTGLDGPRAPLPSFTPVRQGSEPEDGKPESSASESLRSRSGGDKSREQTPTRQSTSSGSNVRPSIEQRDDQAIARRDSNRSSGGFLIDSVGRSSRVSRSFLQRTQHNVKGKRKSDEGDLSIPKRRLREAGHKQTSSLGSSPLSKEVAPDPQPAGNGSIVPGTDVRISADYSMTSVAASRSSTAPGVQLASPAANVGFDTDPAQIVNMALSLSAARQRQASAKRYMSGDQTRSRALSGATGQATRDEARVGSIAQYLTPGRTTSVGSRDSPRMPANAMQQAQEQQATAPPEFQDAVLVDEGEEAEISQATAQRVQKARVYFELAYEHRRLLSHLPPIARPGTRVRAPSPDSQSKAYNPLQYIRNRKLRLWDKTAIDAEGEGWHDIEKVKTWVNAVVESHQETRHEPDEVVRLPPLSKSNTGEDSESDAKKGKSPIQQEQVRRRRPRSDWVTHPGDMIADCFWLEQGVNKIKILDRDNNNIYPQNTHFSFSGWRTRAGLLDPADLQQASPPPDEFEEVDREQLEDAPPLPTFKSAHYGNGDSGLGRTKPKGKLKHPFGGSGDRLNRRKGLKMVMDDSDSGSDSERSPGASENETERGRKRLSKKWQKHMQSDGSSGPNSLRSPPTKDSMVTSTLSPSDQSAPNSAPTSKRTSLDVGILSKLKRDTTKGHSPSHSRNRNDHSRQESTHKFPSFHDHPRSSGEYDTTAPSSPIASHAPKWPSIAINLESPPRSRSASPTKKAQHLNPFRNRSHDRADGVSRSDFANEAVPAHRQLARAQDDESDHSRGTSPLSRGQNVLSKSQTQTTVPDFEAANLDHRASIVSKTSVRSAAQSAKDDHGRIRGIFKGGRIAEIVGNEVSRAGAFIWKRDPPGLHRRHDSASTNSLRSRHDSDSEGETYVNGTIVKTPPKPPNLRSRSSTISTTQSEKSPTLTKSSPGSGENPKYNNPNLPSFTSPFQRDKEKQDQQQSLLTPTSAPDHISRQAAERRSTSRSPRLDKLAPSKLDISRASSPTRPDGMTYVATDGFGPVLDLTNSRTASDKYNSAIATNKSADNLKSSSLHPSQSALDLSRISSRSLGIQDDQPQPVTTADIDRARVLLLSSAIKAREIGRRADAPRGHTPQYLLDTVHSTTHHHTQVDLSLVSRREEHVVAARNIMSALSEHGSVFDEKIKHFSGSIAPNLHRSLQELEDLVDNQMTPRVRASADEAGELGSKLTTSSTLAVKSLNDTIDSALRRRRRGPVRWIRRAGFAMIEYVVVGLLWGIWAVVTIVRVALAVVMGVRRGVGWVLWLD